MPGSEAVRTVVARLGDREALRRARIHPLAVLAAMKTYAQGRGMKGSGKWDPVSQAAKLVVVAMSSNGFSIADPNDGGMLAVVGFDAATPEVISDCGR